VQALEPGERGQAAGLEGGPVVGLEAGLREDAPGVLVAQLRQEVVVEEADEAGE